MTAAAAPPAYDDDLDARAAIAAAVGRAGRSGKRVAIVFGADWCPDCNAFDAALRHPRSEPIVERAFEVVRISVGRRDLNLDLMAEVGLDVHRGIPAIAFLDGSGRLISALRDGELRSARSLAPLEILDLLLRQSAVP